MIQVSSRDLFVRPRQTEEVVVSIKWNDEIMDERRRMEERINAKGKDIR